MGRVFKPKRKQKDGSIWESPKWYVEYWDANGIQRRKPVGESKKEARALLKELEGQTRRVKLGLDQAPKKNGEDELSDLIPEYLAEQEQRLKKTTIEDYKQALNDLQKQLKVKKVSELTLPLVDAYKRKALKTATGRTVAKKLMRLQTMLTWAKGKQLLTRNPLEGLTLPSQKPQVPLRALEEEEIQKLLKVSPKDVGEVWEVLLGTGLRKKELATLRVKDVDLKKGHLIVRKEISKNDKARQVPLSKRVKQILKARCKDKEPKDMVIQGIGKWADFYEGAHRELMKACKKAEIDTEGINVHSLRRTFATRLIAKGATPGAVQKLLGHSTVTLTLELYTKARQSDLQDAISKLN